MGHIRPWLLIDAPVPEGTIFRLAPTALVLIGSKTQNYSVERFAYRPLDWLFFLVPGLLPLQLPPTKVRPVVGEGGV